MTEAKKVEIPRMTEREVTDLAERIIRGEIFTSNHVDFKEWEAMLPSIFMTVALGGLEGIEGKDLGMLWEEYAKAGPRSVNGYPTFVSAHLVHREDTLRVIEKVKAMEAALQKARDA